MTEAKLRINLLGEWYRKGQITKEIFIHSLQQILTKEENEYDFTVGK